MFANVMSVRRSVQGFRTLYMNGPQGKLIHANVEIQKARGGTDLTVIAQYAGKDIDFVAWAKGGKACAKA